MIIRLNYLREILSHKDKKTIKVITGMRGCGKSVLLEQYQKVLTGKGLNERSIISIRLDEPAYEKLLDYRMLYTYIVSHLQKNSMTYIFLDEVQQCRNFSKVVIALLKLQNTDIYIAGSSSDIIHRDFQALPAGTVTEIKMLPFTFDEYSDAQKQSLLKTIAAQSPEQHFTDFIKFGNLPFTIQLFKNARNINQYLLGLYNTIIVRDIANRHTIKDIKVLESVIKYIFSNPGSSITSKKLSDMLTEKGIKTTQPTVENYMTYLQDCYLVRCIDRFDLKNREYLKTLSKYYPADPGMANLMSGHKLNMNHILKSLVLSRLLKDGFTVYSGKISTKEIDFVAMKDEQMYYIQVEAEVKDNKILAKKIKPFKMVKDFYPRVLISLDRSSEAVSYGVKHINALEFLSKGEL
ncbi:MAG: ATP-binding protein [Spirochaetia bacterium]|nr:ATP-binding protein [Spirochaetia bacterium]